MRPLLRTAGWIVALAAALAGLLRVDGGVAALPGPDASSIWTWIQRTEPATATFALLRLGALVVVAYLLLATVVLVAADATRVRGLITVAHHATLPVARRVVRHAVGTGLALGLATSTPLVAGAQPPPAPTTTLVAPEPAAPPVLQQVGGGPVLVHLGPAGVPAGAPGAAPPPTPPPAPRPPPGPMTTATGPTTPPSTRSAPASPVPTSSVPADEPPPAAAPPPASGPDDLDRRGGAGGPAATHPGGATEPGDPAPSSSFPSRAPTPAGSIAAIDDLTDDRTGEPDDLTRGHRTIVTGDHLWGIAEQTLTSAWRSAPAPPEIATYLARLIDDNRTVLAVPDDPDLVFPGQVFTLPAVPAR